METCDRFVSRAEEILEGYLQRDTVEVKKVQAFLNILKRNLESQGQKRALSLEGECRRRVLFIISVLDLSLAYGTGDDTVKVKRAFSVNF